MRIMLRTMCVWVVFGWSSLFASAVPIQDVVLFDFETESEASVWSVRDLTDLSLTDTWAAVGSRSAAIHFSRWVKGQEQWPAAIVPASGLATTDFSPYRDLCWEAYNPGSVAVEVKLHLRDQATRLSHSFQVAPGQHLSVRVPLSTTGLDLARIGELHFFVTRPAADMTLYIDHIRLSSGLLEDARDLYKRSAGLASRFGYAVKGIRTLVPRALRSEDARAAEVRDQARALLERLEGDAAEGDIDDYRAALAEVRAGVHRLDGVEMCMKAARYAAARLKDDFLVTTVSSMRKVSQDVAQFDIPFASGIELWAARNEHEHAQAVIIPFAGDLTDVSWELLPLTNAAGAELPAEVRLVGYVNCEQPSYPVSRPGWWPDPLLPGVTSMERVPLGEVLPLWFSVSVPDTAAAGEYQGTLLVRARDLVVERVSVRVTVWDFTLPSVPPLRTALSFRTLSPKLYPAEAIPGLVQTYEDWMLDEYGLNPGNIYSSAPPSWSAERLRDLVDRGLNAINLAYFNAPRGDAFDETAYWKRFDEQVRAVESYMPVIEAAGARDLCYFYCFDERPAEQLDIVFATAKRLKQLWPDIEVMTTAYDRTFGLEREDGDAVDIWVPLTPHFDTNAARLAEARRQGRDIWWYICIGPKNPHANWFVEYSAIEPRLIMGAMAAKYEPGGFLYYAVNRWPLNDRPLGGGPRTDWNPASYKNNNGDGSIMCAGPEGPLATIRLENIRDGLEDLAYYQMLRELRQRRRSPGALLADTFSWPIRRLGPGGGRRHKGRVSPQVVEDLSHYTRDPAVLEEERHALARELVRLSRRR